MWYTRYLRSNQDWEIEINFSQSIFVTLGHNYPQSTLSPPDKFISLVLLFTVMVTNAFFHSRDVLFYIKIVSEFIQIILILNVVCISKWVYTFLRIYSYGCILKYICVKHQWPAGGCNVFDALDHYEYKDMYNKMKMCHNCLWSIKQRLSERLTLHHTYRAVNIPNFKHWHFHLGWATG